VLKHRCGKQKRVNGEQTIASSKLLGETTPNRGRGRSFTLIGTPDSIAIANVPTLE
jgi:hypothetical protein